MTTSFSYPATTRSSLLPLPISHYSSFGLLLVMGLLYFTSLHSFLLFHSLVELFSILVFFGIFVIAWNARHIIKSHFLLFLGIAYLFVGVIDLEHTLAYKGMEILPHYAGANHATQLWIAARYSQSLALLAAPFFLQRRIRPRPVLALFALCSILLLWVIHTGHFPVCYVEGSGLTSFKKISEYIISLILVASFAVLRRQRHLLNPNVYRLVAASIFCTIASELAFTTYVSVFGQSNLLGHFFKFIAAYLIYVALIETGLKAPYSLLFHELKTNEEILSAREAEFRSIFELSAVGMAELSPSAGKFIRVNQKLCEITGYTAEELTGMEAIELTHPADRRRDRAAFVEYMQGKTPNFSIEKRYVRKDGKVIWIRVTASLIHAEDGRPLRSIGIIEDITARRRDRELLRESEKQQKRRKEELEREVSRRTAELAETVDQLRTLALQLSETENRERRRLAEILHDDLQQLLAAANMHLDKLKSYIDTKQHGRIPVIRDILAQAIKISRSMSHELSPAVLYRGNLNAIFDWLASHKLEHHDLSVTVTMPVNLQIESDPLRVFLFRAVQELLFNVVKHAGTAEAAISVELQKNDTLLVTVADEGRGFDPETLFGSAAGKTGSGFGLFSIRERLHLLGGSLTVTSSPGHGSRFTIRLPLHGIDTLSLPFPSATREKDTAASPLPANAGADAAAPRKQPIRIVLADDHETIRHGLEVLLREEEDLEIVGLAGNGIEAVRLAGELRPDVMVMDMTMPEMDGIEATGSIARQWPEVAIIVFSMHEDREIANTALAAGAKAYCSKAEHTEKLLDAIREFGGRKV